MTKYLETERFLVTSNDKDARKRYNENYDRIFGKKDEEPALEDDFSSHCGHPRGSDQCHDCLPLEEADTSAIECRLGSYADLIVHAPPVGLPAEHVEGCIVPNCPGCDDGHPETAPTDPCEVCGALAGEWCKHGCSEGPAQPKP